MQFAGRLDKQDIAEALALVRSKGSQARSLMWVVRLVLVAGLLAVLTIRFLHGPTRANPSVLVVPWLIVLGVLGLAVFLRTSSKARVAARVSTRVPDWIDLGDSGVKTDGPDGATSFQPWANVKGWREGRRVIVLQSKTGVLAILPVTDLSDAARQPLRDLLKTHIAASPGAP